MYILDVRRSTYKCMYSYVLKINQKSSDMYFAIKMRSLFGFLVLFKLFTIAL